MALSAESALLLSTPSAGLLFLTLQLVVKLSEAFPLCLSLEGLSPLDVIFCILFFTSPPPNLLNKPAAFPTGLLPEVESIEAGFPAAFPTGLLPEVESIKAGFTVALTACLLLEIGPSIEVGFPELVKTARPLGGRSGTLLLLPTSPTSWSCSFTSGCAEGCVGPFLGAVGLAGGIGRTLLGEGGGRGLFEEDRDPWPPSKSPNILFTDFPPPGGGCGLL